MQSELKVTGERVIEAEYLRSRETYLIYLFHIATYRFSIPYVTGARVLDFGCGSGYGASLLAGHAASVTGVDLSPEAIDYAKSHYPRPNLVFRTIERIERAPLPFPDSHFDAVVSFQVIEHIRDSDVYLAEIERVLKPGGWLLIATPDRGTRLLPGQRPWNRFHVREYSASALGELLSRHFADVELHAMSGTPSTLEPELRRTRLLKWITLPFTFPLAPEAWRIWGLNLLHRWRRPGKSAATPDPAKYGIGEADIVIGAGLAPSVNLVATARRR